MKSKTMKKVVPRKHPPKVGGAILISDKVHFKVRDRGTLRNDKI